jgi:hypothetical protein
MGELYRKGRSSFGKDKYPFLTGFPIHANQAGVDWPVEKTQASGGTGVVRNHGDLNKSFIECGVE